MKSASDGLPPGARRGAQATARLAKAMQQIPDEVMIYLAESSGFYRTQPPTLTHAEMMFIEGRRSLFGEILHYYTNTGSDVWTRLRDRAVAEAKITSVEGTYEIME